VREGSDLDKLQLDQLFSFHWFAVDEWYPNI